MTLDQEVVSLARRARETSKFGTPPTIAARWKVSGVDQRGTELVSGEAVETCSAEGTTLLDWSSEMYVDRVTRIVVEFELDVTESFKPGDHTDAHPDYIVVAEAEDTKYRQVQSVSLDSERRRCGRLEIDRSSFGDYLLLSVHVVRTKPGIASGTKKARAGRYLARTPHTERLKVRLRSPDWRDGGGLEIDWVSFNEQEKERLWRWSGIASLDSENPILKLEVHAECETLRSLLSTTDSPRSLPRTWVGQLVVAQALLEIALEAAARVSDGKIPEGSGIEAVLKMVAQRITADPIDVVAKLQQPRGIAEIAQRLRVAYGFANSLEELAERALRGKA
jgi:hypothetical protein